jgi:hypothetical protein
VSGRKAPNGATYTVERQDTTAMISAFGEAWRWVVRIDHPDHEPRIIVADYSGHPFGDSRGRAVAFAAYDGRLEYRPGATVFERKSLDVEGLEL